jgi:DNA-binding transcriptional LysR family regulator
LSIDACRKKEIKTAPAGQKRALSTVRRETEAQKPGFSWVWEPAACATIGFASPIPFSRGRWSVAMFYMTLAGLGWATTPLVLAKPYLAAGRLVELSPQHRISVSLYWQRTRLSARLLDHLTQAIRTAAAGALTPA